MILYASKNKQVKEFTDLSNHFPLDYVFSAQEAIDKNLLTQADVFLLGNDLSNPVKEVQHIFAADKHLSVIILAEPANYKRIKQSVQLAPFIGKNALVVAHSPEMDLQLICQNAATRTKQKRSFHKINFTQSNIVPAFQRVKLAQMGAFLEYAPIAALLVNEKDRIENYNQQAGSLFPKLQYLDVEFNQLFSQKETGLIKAFIHDNHNPELRLELTIENKILEVTSNQVYDEEGQKYFLLLFNDITNERQASQRIHAILEALPQMAWTTDADGNALYFNRGWYFYTGQTNENALGSGWMAAILQEDLERFLIQWKISLASGKSFQHAARFRNVNGDYRWHLSRASAIMNNQDIRWVGTSTDIHDQILLTEELEKKVNERTHLLQVSNHELEQFAHVSSHDLQEPLRKIRTFADLLKNGDLNLNESSKKYIDKICTTAERMSDSLKALLNFTRLNREEKFVPVNLNNIIAQVLIDLELMIAQRNAVVQVEDIPVVKAIPIQMQQLFYNLINNALKFSQKDRPAEIEITSHEMGDEAVKSFPVLIPYKPYIEIVVKDNGIGFDQKHADKIFAVFQRLHSKSEYEGTGIGLSLVKKVVRNHKGEIYAVSQSGQGTSFHIILPLS